MSNFLFIAYYLTLPIYYIYCPYETTIQNAFEGIIIILIQGNYVVILHRGLINF